MLVFFILLKMEHGYHLEGFSVFSCPFSVEDTHSEGCYKTKISELANQICFTNSKLKDTEWETTAFGKIKCSSLTATPSLYHSVKLSMQQRTLSPHYIVCNRVYFSSIVSPPGSSIFYKNTHIANGPMQRGRDMLDHSRLLYWQREMVIIR